MTKVKMTLKEAMELIEALKAEKAEAVEKAEKAEAEAAEAKNQLETELRKADNDEFDKAIRPKFDFFEYAVPGLGFEKKHDYVRYCDITFTANELLNMMKAHKPGGQYWEMREKSAEEFVIDLKHAIANKHKNANRPQFVFFREKIIRALPPVNTPVARTTKTAVKKAEKVRKAAQGALDPKFNVEAFNDTFTAAERANKRALVPVARGYMLQEAGKPIVRVFITRNGFKLARRANHSMIEILPDESTLAEALTAYTLDRAAEWK